MTDTIPAAVVMARSACAAMSEPQRMAFAMELVRDITDFNCVFQLKRLEALAAQTSAELIRAKFMSECG